MINYFKMLNYSKHPQNFNDFEKNLISYRNEYSLEFHNYNNNELRLRNNDYAF